MGKIASIKLSIRSAHGKVFIISLYQKDIGVLGGVTPSTLKSTGIHYTLFSSAPNSSAVHWENMGAQSNLCCARKEPIFRLVSSNGRVKYISDYSDLGTIRLDVF